jgi:phosphonate transport system substrate-binding protein
MASSQASKFHPDTLVIGKISHNPKKHYHYLKPMVKYAVKHMQDLGINKSKILLARSKEHLADLLEQGEVDWITETPVAAAYLHEKSGAEILLKKWKKGVSEYHSVFFTLSGHRVGKLHDLKGKVIALEDPASTSAFYFPAYTLIENGLRLVKLDSVRDKAPTDAVGFVFTREEINIATLVHKGIVDAGAFSNDDWDKEDHLPKRYRRDLKIFHRTPNIIRAVEMVRQDLDPTIRQRLQETLLKANDNPAAASVFRAYQKTKKFDKLSKEQKEAVYKLSKVVRIVDETVVW